MSGIIAETGNVYNRLTVLGEFGRDKHQKRLGYLIVNEVVTR